MDVSKRVWWIRLEEDEEGPIDEEMFQERLRAGKVPLGALVKSNYMNAFEPLLSYISEDETFRRPSTTPPPVSPDDNEES